MFYASYVRRVLRVAFEGYRRRMRTRVEGARLLDFGEGPVPPVYCLQEQRSTSEKRYSCFGGVQGIINQARGIRGVPNLFHVLNCRHPSPLPAQQTDNWHPLTYTTSSGLHYWYPHHQTPLTTCIIQLYAFTAIVATMTSAKERVDYRHLLPYITSPGS